jgi:hypothetical protein
VRDYIRKELGHDEEQEGPFMFETFNQADMDRVVRPAAEDHGNA